MSVLCSMDVLAVHDLEVTKTHHRRRSSVISSYQCPSRTPVPCTQLAAQLQRQQHAPCIKERSPACVVCKLILHALLGACQHQAPCSEVPGTWKRLQVCQHGPIWCNICTLARGSYHPTLDTGGLPKGRHALDTRPLNHSAFAVSSAPDTAAACQLSTAHAHALGQHSGNAAVRATDLPPACSMVATRCTGAPPQPGAPVPCTYCSSASARCRVSATSECGLHRSSAAACWPGGLLAALAPPPGPGASGPLQAAANDTLETKLTTGCWLARLPLPPGTITT